MDKFTLVYGFGSVVEGRESFDTAEQAHQRAYDLGTCIGVTFAHDAVEGLRARGEYEYGGEWFRLENGREACRF